MWGKWSCVIVSTSLQKAIGARSTKQLVVKCPSWISSVRIAQNQILKKGPVQRCRKFNWVKCLEQDNVSRELLSLHFLGDAE